MATTEVTLVIYDQNGRGLDYWQAVVEEHGADVVEDACEETEVAE